MKTLFYRHTSSGLRLLITSFLPVGLVFLTACGSSTVEKQDSASRGVATPSPIQQKLAECNRVSAQKIAVEGHISTYYEPTTGRMRADFINMSLQTIPNEVASKETYTIQFFRFSEKTPGNRQVNSLPTRFLVMDRLNGSYFINNTVDRISKSLVDTVIKSLGDKTTVTPENFVQRAHFILTGVDFTYDGISVSLVDSNSSVVSSVDLLLPPFYADPNIYAAKIKIPYLQSLHPFYNLRSSGGTEADFYNMSEEICAEMISAASRVPASTSSPQRPPVNLWNRLLNWANKFFNF